MALKYYRSPKVRSGDKAKPQHSAQAGLRLALFPFDPTTLPPHRDSSLDPSRTAETALANGVSTAEYSSQFQHHLAS